MQCRSNRIEYFSSKTVTEESPRRRPVKRVVKEYVLRNGLPSFGFNNRTLQHCFTLIISIYEDINAYGLRRYRMWSLKMRAVSTVFFMVFFLCAY